MENLLFQPNNLVIFWEFFVPTKLSRNCFDSLLFKPNIPEFFLRVFLFQPKNPVIFKPTCLYSTCQWQAVLHVHLIHSPSISVCPLSNKYTLICRVHLVFIHFTPSPHTQPFSLSLSGVDWGGQEFTIRFKPNSTFFSMSFNIGIILKYFVFKITEHNSPQIYATLDPWLLVLFLFSFFCVFSEDADSPSPLKLSRCGRSLSV